MQTVDQLLLENRAYQHSRQSMWEKRSSIRTRPRRFVSEEDVDKGLYFFPVARQPLCVHPKVVSLGDEAKQYILTQSSYKFMMDVAVLETEVVNAGALLVANNKLRFHYPGDLRHDALSVIIDEAYHAYVAIDFMRQIETLTGIAPLSMSKSTPVMKAIEYIKNKLEPEYMDLFFLIAVCIGEHVLTNDLISIGKDKTICQTFSEVMADHVLDEGRHANIFAEIMAWTWERMSNQERLAIGTKLPDFMRAYLKNDIQKDFGTKILHGLNKLKEQEVSQMIDDTYMTACSNKLDSENPVISNLMKMLNRCRVLEHEATNRAFQVAISE